MTTFLDYSARGKNAWWRYLIAAILGFVLMIVLTVLVTLPLALLHLLPPDFKDQMRHATKPAVFFLTTGVTFALTVVAYALAIRLIHGKRPADLLGLWRWRDFGFGLALWLGVLVIATLVDWVLAPKGFTFTATRQTPILALTALIGLSAQTFAEEFLFRGYVTQGLLLATRRPLVAAVISGLVFGALHIPNGWPQAANAVVFGTVLALVAIRTGGLALGWGVHLINNLYGAVVVVSGDDVFRGSPGLVTQQTKGLLWWDTAFGAMALLALGYLVVRRSGGLSRLGGKL